MKLKKFKTKPKISNLDMIYGNGISYHANKEEKKPKKRFFNFPPKTQWGRGILFFYSVIIPLLIIISILSADLFNIFFWFLVVIHSIFALIILIGLVGIWVQEGKENDWWC